MNFILLYSVPAVIKRNERKFLCNDSMSYNRCAIVLQYCQIFMKIRIVTDAGI